MASSPPKRLKIAPSLPSSDLLHYSHKQHPTPSKLPVRGGSTVTRGPLYGPPPRSKGPRHSPYGERPASVRPNGAEGVRLNFGTLREGGARFRRVGGPRLSQSPTRRSTYFNDPQPTSGVQRMGILGVASVSPPESPGDAASSSSPEQAQPSRKIHGLEIATKAAPPPANQLPSKTAEEIAAELIDAGGEALRKLLEARVNALRMEVDALKEEVQVEEARVDRETRAVPESAGNDMEALVKRLLSANDSSHASLPVIRPTSPEVPSAKPLLPADPLSQLSAFHCLTFTSTTTTTIASPELPLADHTPITQRHSASGFAANRLLFFKLTFDVSAPSWHVDHTTYTVSPWARQELQRPLDRAASECDINSILYALSSYTTLARTRATVFAALGRAFPKLLPVLAPREGRRRELVSWLGTALLRFRSKDADGGVELVVSWNIAVGVGGEAESCVEADVRLPVNWTDADEMRSLAKVGDVFRNLVKERGVFEAVKCVVGLVFQ